MPHTDNQRLLGDLRWRHEPGDVPRFFGDPASSRIDGLVAVFRGAPLPPHSPRSSDPTTAGSVPATAPLDS